MIMQLSSWKNNRNEALKAQKNLIELSKSFDSLFIICPLGMIS